MNDTPRSTHAVRISEVEVTKTYDDPLRGEPQREWSALQLLAEYAPGLAPIPLGLTGPPWVLRMSRLSGEPQAHAKALSPKQMRSLGEAFERLWASVPCDALAPLPPRILGPRDILGALSARLANVGRATDSTCDRAVEALDNWVTIGASADLAEPCQAEVLGQGDPNLDNFLFDQDEVHLVDFEDAGRSCRAYELGVLIEHLSSRGTPDAAWLELADHHSDGCTKAFVGARRAFAGFWLLLLLPGGPSHARNPPGADTAQARRLLSLFA